MELIRARDYAEMSDIACKRVCAAVRGKPDMVLGLATGGTPLGMYERLAAAHRSGKIDLSGIRGVNLDEYVGIDGGHVLSYRWYMWYNLYTPIGLAPGQAHIPDGMATDLAAECARYDETIRSLGGIDLQVLGIGANGHIGFNEPGDAFVKNAHIAWLSESTRRGNARYFDSPDQVPTAAVTVGVGAIMAAKRILLLAGGPEKAGALKAALEGGITPRVPASILQLHPCVTVIADEGALAELGEIKK